MRKALYILGQLDDADAAWMVQTGRRVALRTGDTLITQGRPLSDLFMVLSGTAIVSVNGSKVAELGAGEMLGEMALIDSSPPSATVTAGSNDFAVLALPTRDLNDRTRTDMGFAARFYRALAVFLADRLRQMNAQMTGAGKQTTALEDEEEIDEMVLDGIHLAGIRFEMILRKMAEV